MKETAATGFHNLSRLDFRNIGTQLVVGLNPTLATRHRCAKITGAALIEKRSLQRPLSLLSGGYNQV